MSQPDPPPVVPKWLSTTVVTLLALQVGLLWLHGNLLQRQHDDMQGLREDVQSLADSLDQEQDGGDSEGDGGSDPAVFQPARFRAARLRPARRHHRGLAVRAAYRQVTSSPAPAEDAESQSAQKDLDATKKSAQDAVAQARAVQETLSIQDNIQKAELKQRQAREGTRWSVWLSGAAVAVLLGGWWFRGRLGRRG